MADVIIRAGSAGDVPSIMSEIIHHVVPIMNSNNNHQWEIGKYPLEKDFYSDIEKGWCFIAEDSTGKLLGVAAITTDQSDYDYDTIDFSQPSIVPHRVAVAPSAQGKGVAQKFIEYAEEVARQKGYSYVRVDTNSMNGTMQRLFTRCGFQFIQEISLKSKPGLSFKLYEKKLL